MSLKLQKAKKKHTCADCGMEIPVGHMYWRDYGDAEKDTKTHTNCELYSRHAKLNSKQ